ncbi:dolichyl-phosphate beta-glucosyltransferase [Lobulomyces angularis]|nr:dolichyl-phosphate beta-glucosyltransferase [Lobulomyces angularis]
MSTEDESIIKNLETWSPTFIILTSTAILLISLTIKYLFINFLKLYAKKPRKPFKSELEFLNLETKKIEKFPSLLTDQATVSLSVIIPAFNEEFRLTKMLDNAVDVSDNTSNVFMKYGEKKNLKKEFKCLKLQSNRGKGGAVTQGMLVAGGKLLLFVDADGASEFSDIELLENALKKISDDGFGIAIGSRAHMVNSEAVIKRSLIRNFLMHSFHKIIYIFGIKNIQDTQCGFKLLTRKSGKKIFSKMNLEGWIFDIEILILAEKLNIPIKEVQVNWKEVEGTKINLLKDSLKMLRDLIVLRLCYYFEIWSCVEDESVNKKFD